MKIMDKIKVKGGIKISNTNVFQLGSHKKQGLWERVFLIPVM